MNNYVTEAINLKSYNLNDADKIMVMYSKENGLIKGVAKGIKKPKSKLGARMDLLVANTLQILKGRSLDTIIQAQTVNHFRKTREDYDKFLKVAQDELPSNLFVQNPRTEELNHHVFTKIRMDNTLFATRHTGKFMNMHNGIFIDILSQDNTSNNKLIQNLHIYTTLITRSMVFNKWAKKKMKTG